MNNHNQITKQKNTTRTKILNTDFYSFYKKKILQNKKFLNISFQNQYFISIPPPAKIDKWFINNERSLYYKEL